MIQEMQMVKLNPVHLLLEVAALMKKETILWKTVATKDAVDVEGNGQDENLLLHGMYFAHNVTVDEYFGKYFGSYCVSH